MLNKLLLAKTCPVCVICTGRLRNEGKLTYTLCVGWVWVGFCFVRVCGCVGVSCWIHRKLRPPILVGHVGRHPSAINPVTVLFQMFIVPFKLLWALTVRLHMVHINVTQRYCA